MDTDFHKIERAFERLNSDHLYFTAQDWMCCDSCGLAEILEIEQDEGIEFPGLVFSNAQAYEDAYLGSMDGIEPPGVWDENDPNFDEDAFFQACEAHRATYRTLVNDLYLTWEAEDCDPGFIVEALRGEGLVVEAPPDETKKIRVLATMPAVE